MRLGFALPHEKPDGSALSAADVMARSQLIERIGFDGIWFGDTISRTPRPRPDVLMTLAVVAAGTARVELGTARLPPWPNTLGGPPMLIGSWHSGPGVKRAARDYDGWIASGLTSFNIIAEGIQRFGDAGGKRAIPI
jgi:alkanesulfonate monooxygenase SsuD/methylene tetrahydromethanopterin reductase-like flavin-dependent oxidoreductase (luciferase family)